LRTLGAMLAGRGATIVGQRAFHRRHVGDDVMSFVKEVMRSVERVSA
jgi:hypothetical protein